MKKWYVVITLCFVIGVICNHRETANPVFEENTGMNDFIKKEINVSNASITTKNITSLLGTLSLHKVSYEIPKLYRSKLSDISPNYFFEDTSKEQGLLEIENYMSNRFKGLGQQREVERIYFYGIPLLSVEVYGRTSEIEAFEQKIKNR